MSPTRARWLIDARSDTEARSEPCLDRCSCDSHANRDAPIRRRAAPSTAVGGRFGVFLENFFIAKFCDSESAARVFSCARLSRTIDRSCARENSCNQEVPVPQGFLARLTRDCLRFLRVVHRGDSTRRTHRLDRAAQLRGHTHQHFLKRRSGFFISLVYSNCSASRIAGCTTLTSHLTLLGGQHG